MNKIGECGMYIISHRQVDGKKIFFGECVEDGFYYENEDYHNVSKKMREHIGIKEQNND